MVDCNDNHVVSPRNAKTLLFESFADSESPRAHREINRMTSLKSAAILALALTTLVACKPEYPKCESDDHCRIDSKLSDVCVNGSCQECLEDAQCIAQKGDNFFCNSGRCDPKPDEVATCAVHSDCTEGNHCDAGICVEGLAQKTCQADIDCGPNAGCVSGFCHEGVAHTLASNDPCQSLSINTVTNELSFVKFEFNNHELSIQSRETLSNAAECLKLQPALKIVIEGHCDERGTQEYNLALGEKRASTVKGYLRNLGVESVRMSTRTFGANKPRCMQPTEECYAINRRVEFIEILKN